MLDVAYPKVIDFAGLTSGIEWWTGESPNKATIGIGTVKDIDLSEVDPDVNVDDSSSYKLNVLDINDKLYIEGHFYFSTNSDVGKVLYASFYLKDRISGRSKNMTSANTGRPYVTGFLSGMYNGYHGTNIFYVPPVMLATYKAKLCLITEYLTPSFADGFGLILLLPTLNTKFPATTQSWTHVVNKYVGDSSSKLYWESVGGESIYYPFAGAAGEVMWVNDFTYFVNFLKEYDSTITIDDIIDIRDDDDPVQDKDPSVPGGGGGGYDGTSDPIDFPNLPRGGALASGGCRAYRPTSQEIKSLMDTLWNTSIFDISTFQKLVDNPMDAIIGLHALPVTPVSEDRALHVFVGNFNTNIAMDRITNQYLTVDCGYINLEEFWGSALDYSPYTKIAVYLPFVGIKDLTIDDVMPKNVRIKYNIDVLTGDCIAFVKCGTAVLYKFAGNMKQDIPLTGQRSDVQLRGLVSTMSIIGSAAMGSAVGGGVGGGMILGATASGIGNVASSKIVTQRSGALGGNVGVLDEFVPYLIIHRPVQSLAKDFKTFKGYPSNITSRLGDLRGYTEVEYVNLGDIPNATSAEMDEIKNLLSKGVLI